MAREELAMEQKIRLFMSLTPAEFNSFESAREELGMNRSQYLRYLLGGQKEIRPPAITQRELIRYLAEVERDLKIIAMKDSLEDGDKLIVMAKLDDIKQKLEGKELLDIMSKGGGNDK